MLRRDFLCQSGVGLGMLFVPGSITHWFKATAVAELWTEFATLLRARELGAAPAGLDELLESSQLLKNVHPFDAGRAIWYGYGPAGEYALGWIPLYIEERGLIGFLAPIYARTRKGRWAKVRTLSSFEVEVIAHLARAGHALDRLMPILPAAPHRHPGYATAKGGLDITLRLSDNHLAAQARLLDGQAKELSVVALHSALL
jgi:hypothetical protein